MSAVVPDARSRRRWWFVSLGLIALLAVGTVSAAFVIQTSAGGAGGAQAGSAFLTHWQQTGVLSAATPNPVPAAVSTVAALPTRLGGASTTFRMNAATAGDQAAEWVFSETTGIATNEEIEIEFVVQYTVGVTSHTLSGSVYLESQAAAIPGTLTFDLFWDAGAAAGITFVAESEISQSCAAVGTCP